MNAAVTAVRHDRQALLKFRRWYESAGRLGSHTYSLSGREGDWLAVSGPRRSESKVSGSGVDSYGFSHASAGRERSSSLSGRGCQGGG